MIYTQVVILPWGGTLASLTDACDSQTAINGVENLYPHHPGAALKAGGGMHF